MITCPGEWNEAVWKEVSLSLSQNFPLGGFVWTKNIPEDHRSNIKLQVPKWRQRDILSLKQNAQRTDHSSEDLQNRITQRFVQQTNLYKLLHVHLYVKMIKTIEKNRFFYFSFSL